MMRERVAHNTITQAIQTARRVHVEDEALTPEDIGIDDVTDVDEAIDLWREADQTLRALKAVKAAAGAQLATLLGDGGAVAVGDVIVRYRLGRKERCHDSDGLAAYATNELVERRVRLLDVTNPAYMKRGWMDTAVRDTFFEWVTDEHAALTETPRGKAPKFLQGLKDGDVFVKGGSDE